MRAKKVVFRISDMSVGCWYNMLNVLELLRINEWCMDATQQLLWLFDNKWTPNDLTYTILNTYIGLLKLLG